MFARLPCRLASRAEIASRKRRRERSKLHDFSGLDSRGCRISNFSVTTYPMSRSPTAIPARERVAALRARREAAGMARVWADLPGELVAQLDQAKQEKGAQSRAPIIEEALRFYFEKQQGA